MKTHLCSKWLIGASISLFALGVQAQELGALILDGKPVPANSDVSKAMMFVSVQGGTCSGVAISKTHVLTAGHCVDKKPRTSQIVVYKGSNKKRASAVKSYEIHPGYGMENSYVKADLAVLKMSSAFGSDVVPAAITGSELPEGLELIAAGFGYSNRAKTRIRTLLQESFFFGQTAEMKPGRFSDGSRLLRLWGSNNLCQGDSGGATFRRTSSGLRTVGIHSMADCDTRGYDVFVLDYTSWIKAQLAK
ncbi:MAG: trypsin-like serine protease [Bdellovibrionaceae bacterium]|nr:trypsin-like serine protease [Pseudobdellovibrionaceae bacterium]